MTPSFLASGSLMSLGSDRIAVGSGARSWQSSPSNTQPSFYFPDFFFEESHPWFTQEHTSETTLEELIKNFSKTDLQKPNIEWQNNGKPLFIHTFHELQTLFAKNQLKKAVPFVFELSKQKITPDIIAWAIFHLLNYAKNRKVHVYGFWDDRGGILGATPEILFTLKNKKQLQTMACAGTARNDDQLERLLNDEKENREHQLVIDGIVESLSPLGTIQIGSLEVLKLPGLSHLVTPIEALLNENTHFETLVKALHPTPALGTFPRESGKQWLSHYQTLMNRKRFGAPVGYTDDSTGVSKCYVAIRNMQWTAEGAEIGAGCGVTSGSKLDQEWEEIKAKIGAIKSMLGFENVDLNGPKWT